MKICKLFLTLLIPTSYLFYTAYASGGDIDFFYTNKRGQLSELMLVFNADEEGCHNFPAKRKVHRISVVDFEYCSVFAESECNKDSVLKAKWKGRTRRNKLKKDPQTKLTRGSLWYLDPKTNVKVRSWFCKEP
jgi:hypothetical protein